MISNLQKKRKAWRRDLNHLEGWRTHFCATVRNARVTKRIQDDYRQRKKEFAKRIRSATSSDSDVVKVFPVSARMYWKAKSGHPVPGFPEVNYSGIPSLAAWIRDATLPAREQHATSMLRKLHGLLNSINMWSNNECTGIRVKYPRIKIKKDLLTPFQTDLERVGFRKRPPTPAVKLI